MGTYVTAGTSEVRSIALRWLDPATTGPAFDIALFDIALLDTALFDTTLFDIAFCVHRIVVLENVSAASRGTILA